MRSQGSAPVCTVGSSRLGGPASVTFVMSMFLSLPGDRAGADGLRNGTGLNDLRIGTALAADPGTLIPVLPPVLAFVHLPGLLAAVVVLGGIVRYLRALLTIVSVVVVGIDGT